MAQASLRNQRIGKIIIPSPLSSGGISDDGVVRTGREKPEKAWVDVPGGITAHAFLFFQPDQNLRIAIQGAGRATLKPTGSVAPLPDQSGAGYTPPVTKSWDDGLIATASE
jgi:hypothetical protein